MNAAGQGLSGAVSVGLAPGTAAAGLAVPLLRTVRERPSGRRPLSQRDLRHHPVGARHERADGPGRPLRRDDGRPRPRLPAPPARAALPRRAAGTSSAARDRPAARTSWTMDLFLPRPYNVVRKMVDDACAGSGLVPHVVAEIESASTLTAVIDEGLGATILPESMARRVVGGLLGLAVADRGAVDRGAAGALPVRPSAPVGAGAGGEGRPDRPRGRLPGSSARAAGPQARRAGHKRALSRQRRSVLARHRPRQLPFAKQTGRGARWTCDEIKELMAACRGLRPCGNGYHQGDWTLHLVRSAEGSVAAAPPGRRAAGGPPPRPAPPRPPTPGPRPARRNRLPESAPARPTSSPSGGRSRPATWSRSSRR